MLKLFDLTIFFFQATIENMHFIPPFNFHNIFIEPWISSSSDTFQVILMGFLVAASCGLIGNFIILRKISLLGDAISHSLLPGVVIAFILSGSNSITALFLGALIMGLLTVFMVEFITRNSKIKNDAAMGIVFSAFFAFGIILITFFADHIDLDLECVLYGEIAFIPLLDHTYLLGIDLGPYPLFRMGLILAFLVIGLLAFYKEIVVSIFDPGLARILGIKPATFTWGLTIVLSIILVSAFKSVGAILVVGMLLFPGASARLLSHDLRIICLLSVLFSMFYAVLGTHLAIWLNTSTAASMIIVAIFILSISLVINRFKSRKINLFV